MISPGFMIQSDYLGLYVGQNALFAIVAVPCKISSLYFTNLKNRYNDICFCPSGDTQETI